MFGLMEGVELGEAFLGQGPEGSGKKQPPDVID